ncbi:MAG: sigma 54-interacting transcriptional regulator [Nannocystaceae bacterium]|nr:sigma 54-interacting transcriptional regulator [bacterium]
MRVVVAAGPDKGRAAELSDAPLTVGRGVGQAMQLSDAAVSRHHLTLRASQSADGHAVAQLAELKGVNPVWTLRAGQRTNLAAGATLEVGETLTLGNTTLAFEAALAEPSPQSEGRTTVELDARLDAGPKGPNRLAALAALGDRLARCGSLQAVYREASQWALQALPASRALVLSTDGSDVLSAATDGTVLDLAVSKALLDRVARETKAFWVRDVGAEPDLADRRSVLLRGIVGAMAAPTSGLVFYVEWGAQEALQGRHDHDALLLLVCAAHLISAFGQGASERNQLEAASKSSSTRPGGGGGSMPRIIGRSAAITRLQVFVERVAPTGATVLLRGESGTGKELAAAMLHAMSKVSGGPFVAINCAAIPEQLLESELFGHEKGAFTGAVNSHDGVFARADGGTLFLDEIGEMSLQTQARMLRVLETRTFTKVGGTGEQSVAVRLIAATHRDLAQMVEQGTFRQDLLYRLSVIQTELAPLRERADDIEPLVQFFANAIGETMGRRIDGIAPDALAVMQRYPWPGNVRELRNMVERALVLGDGAILELDDLPPEMQHAAPKGGSAGVTAGPAVTPGTIRTLAELEREAIAAALTATGGNKARAAALLGIDRTTLYRKLKDHTK